nr:MAG: RNA dependent RNA polymerase [Moniliophthora roreri-associated narnavirus 1]
MLFHNKELDDFDEFLLESMDDPRDHQAGSNHYTDQFMSGTIQSDIEDGVRTLFNTIRNAYKFPDFVPFDNLFDKASYPDEIHAIRSMVGDDEVITTDSLAYAILCILIGPQVSQIRISWEDVQWNSRLFNYAEGWIFLPPSRDSSFEAVTRFNRGNGVPFVLDGVKFKDLSCVRKQSAMNVDLASKFKNLSQKATWTNINWPTWNSHQFALVLGIEIFDFLRSKVYPFLFGWEGGCGGAPPWNNMFTAGACMYKFRGGRAKRGILGIMHDSNRLQAGQIRPEQAFFTKNLNLAMSGDKAWLTIRSQLERDKHEHVLEGEDYYPDVVETADRLIPDELVEKSATLYPEDAFTGVAMSYLREKGYILTELDLVERAQNEERLRAIWGRIPMMDIENQIEVRKEEYRESFHQTLTEIADRRILEPVMQAYANLDDPLSPESIGIMATYYRIRIEQALRFNSFIYNERIRIFKYEDVEAYYQRGAAGIRDQFSKSIEARYRPEIRRQPQFPMDDHLLDEIEKWLRSAPLEYLMKQPMPPGIGPDDSRIARDLELRVSTNPDYDGWLFLIISSDRQLISSAHRLLNHNHGDKVIRVVGLSVQDYLKVSLARPTNVSAYRVSGLRPKPWLQTKIWNPSRRAMEPMPAALSAALAAESKWFWNCKRPKIFIEYDYPNINRGLTRFTQDSESLVVTEFTGGYLSRNYVVANSLFPILGLDKIERLSEFDYRARRAVVPIDLLSRSKIRLIPGTGDESSYQTM